jgi:site-specific DNA recombinase
MIGIYCRTSKARNYKYTIEVQKDKGIEFAKKENLPYKVYVDDGISGSKDESTRIGLSELFNDIKLNKLTVVYVYDQSRIERDTPTWQLFVSICLNYKVKYFPGGSEYNLDDPSNRMLAELLSVVNSFYTVLTSQKVREANARKVKEGKTHGMLPYGYTRDEKNLYVILEEEAKHVRRIFDLSFSGIGAYTIANIFNNEGIPTKFKRNYEGVISRKDLDTNKTREFKKENITWRGNVISDMIRNPIYKGTRIWNMYETIPEYVDGKSRKKKRLVDQIITKDLVPPIINEELWDKVQSNLLKNKKNVGPKVYYHYLLNGLLVCGYCGNEFRGKMRPKGNDMSYKCTNKRYSNAKCDNRSINIPKLDTFILKLLLINHESSLQFKNLPNRTSQLDDLNKTLQIKKEEVSGYSKKIKTLVQLISDFNGDFKEVQEELSALKQKQDRSLREIDTIEKRILDESKGSFDENLIQGKRKLDNLTSKLNAPENFELIRNILKSLLESVTINYQKETGTYFLKISLKGKYQTLFSSHYRYSDIWKLTDENGNSEFDECPNWMYYTGDYVLRIYTYSYKIRIAKEDYIKFD